MGRPRLIGLLVGAFALLALAAPSSALAGTFSWTLPNDFTTAPPGSNPEHKYGAVSWTYEVDGAPFSQFSSNADGAGHPGWSDSNGDYIADRGGALAMQSAFPLTGSAHSVTIAWTNPFPSRQVLTVTSTLTPSLTCSITQTPAGSSLTLAPGATVKWTLKAPAVPGPVDCTATGGVQVSASTPGPTVTLNSPGDAPLHSGSVQLSGTASTGFTDSNQVSVAIYSGTDTTSAPAHELTGTVDASGAFTVQTPTLPDGRYTAVASQSSSNGTGRSPAVTFRIKVSAPQLALFRPPGDVWIGRKNLSFSGRAGNELGDANKVTLELFRGTSTSGAPAGKRDVPTHGSNWSTGWHGLHLGYYTVVAMQSDDAGHTTKTAPRTFRLISRTSAFGSSVRVAGNIANIAVGCLAASNQTCRGTVLVVTKHSYRTSHGGPSGPLEVLFANVRIPGGAMGVISGRVPSSALRVLKRLRHTRVIVTSKLSSGKRSASRVLRVS